MPLETATFISDLATSNPAHTDGLSQADSHMRLIKSTLKATFPNFTSTALQSTQAQIDLATSQAQGLSAAVIPMGTAALPGIAFLADLGTGIFQPAAGQIGMSLTGSQVLLMGSSALVTSLGIGAPAITITGAYSGGTGQLVPIGGTLIWWDDVLPVEGGYTWCNGAPISRAANPILFARWGTRYGAGDGSTTFGIPDLRETAPVGQAGMGATGSRSLVNGYFGSLTTTIGALFGAAYSILTTGNLPPYTPAGEIEAFTAGTIYTQGGGSSFVAGEASPGTNGASSGPIPITATTTSTFYGNAQGGTSTPVFQVQPSTTCNYILRAA